MTPADLDRTTAARIANLGQDDQADERSFLRRWREEQEENYDLEQDSYDRERDQA